MTTTLKQPAMACCHSAAAAIPAAPVIRLRAQVPAVATTTVETVKTPTEVSVTATKLVGTAGKAAVATAARAAVSKAGAVSGTAAIISAAALPGESQPGLSSLQHQMQQLQQQIQQQQCLQLQQYQQQIQLQCRQQQLLFQQLQYRELQQHLVQQQMQKSDLREQQQMKEQRLQLQQQNRQQHQTPQQQQALKQRQSQEGKQQILSLAVVASQPNSVSKIVTPDTTNSKCPAREAAAQRFVPTPGSSLTEGILSLQQKPVTLKSQTQLQQRVRQQHQEGERQQQQQQHERQPWSGAGQQGQHCCHGVATSTQQQQPQQMVVAVVTSDTSQRKTTGEGAHGQLRPQILPVQVHVQKQQLQQPQGRQQEQRQHRSGVMDLQLPTANTQKNRCQGEIRKSPVVEAYSLLQQQQEQVPPGTLKENPKFVRYLCFASSAGAVVLLVLCSLHVSLAILQPATYILVLAQGAAASLALLWESRGLPQLQVQQALAARYCPFLLHPVYKGLFYIYLGAVSLALQAAATMNYFSGASLVLAGALCIAVQKESRPSQQQLSAGTVAGGEASPRDCSTSASSPPSPRYYHSFAIAEQ